MAKRLVVVAAVALTTIAALTAFVTGHRPAVRPAAANVFFGIDLPADTAAALSSVTRAAGEAPTVESVFVKLDSTSFTVNALQAIRSRGMTPFVTLEPWSYRDRWGQSNITQYSLRSLVAGHWDGQLRHIAGILAAYDHPVYLRFAHEMNGWWYPWAVNQNGNDATLYVQAWRHVARIVRGAARANVSLVWSPNLLTGSSKESPISSSYPGDQWVDYMGLTAYNRTLAPSTTLTPSYNALTKVSSKPIILSETGASGAGKLGWIRAFGPYLASHRRITGFIWFNTTPASGASGDYRFNQTSADAQAFKVTLQSLRRDRH